MSLRISISEDGVNISGFDDEEYEYDNISMGLRNKGEMWFELGHESDKVVFYLTFDEAIRVAYELKRFAESYK